MTPEVDTIQKQIEELKKQLSEARKAATPQPVQDYEFSGPGGSVRLSELFGDHDDLLLVHNMGGACNYCTMWADGFSGYLRHLEARAAFVLVSPDSPDNQAKLAAGRGWKFRMVQDATKTFSADMGFWSEADGWWPGVSAFHRDGTGQITRTGKDMFGPGDDYNLVWPMFELLSGGAAEFKPH